MIFPAAVFTSSDIEELTAPHKRTNGKIIIEKMLINIEIS